MRALPRRYLEVAPIATGGMGEVIRVQDLLLQSTVAMKVALPHVMENAILRHRFSDEARLTAQLQHPGIIAVHDLGSLPDGSLYFTMEEVRGRTLAEGDLALRDALAALLHAARALGYAHEQGIVHRDVKPDNVMVAAYGEVRVMDWGLARRLDEPDLLADLDSDGRGDGRTEIGEIVGTIPWIAPEQAQGERDAIGPEADVYGLGALLYRLLTGRPPYVGPDALRALLDGPPPPISDGPARLVALCNEAMDRTPWRRPLTGSRFAERLQSWINEERAMDLVRGAQALAPEVAALRQRAAEVDQAIAAMGNTPPHAPVAVKLPMWRAEDEAQDLRRRARLVEIEMVQRLRSALNGAPDLPEAHGLLAAFHADRLVDAKRRGDADAALEHEALLRVHDRGEHRAWLEGKGRLTLLSDPPAHVAWSTFKLRDRRLVPVPAGDLGQTPLRGVALPLGSHVLTLTAPHCAPIRIPVLVERGGACDMTPPGARSEVTHRLPRDSELGPDDVYVASGWFHAYGDPGAPDPLPPQRVWVDAFVIHRHPVTVARWCAFLDSVPDPERWIPQDHASEVALPVRQESGRWVPDRSTARGQPDVPITGVSWWAARAFAACEAERTGLPWRLPHDLEWEKAARGVDGRHLPWGHHAEPRWARVVTSEAGPAEIASVNDYPLDEGPYGVRGQAGNVRDWCGNRYARSGVEDGSDRVIVDAAWRPKASDFVLMRGGAYTTTPRQMRAAGRFADPPHQTYRSLGLRLCRSAPG